MSNNKINQLEKNDSNQYQQIDNFFLLTIKLKNVFDRFYKKWTEISYKTSEGIAEYTQMNNKVVAAYNPLGNIDAALTAYYPDPDAAAPPHAVAAAPQNTTGLFSKVWKLHNRIRDSKQVITRLQYLPSADNIDALIRDVIQKKTDTDPNTKPDEINTRGFQLVVYHYIYSVRLLILHVISRKTDRKKANTNIKQNNITLEPNSEKFLPKVIRFGNSLQLVDIITDPKITINFKLIRCSINNVDLLSILSTPYAYTNIIDVLTSLRDNNKTRELSYIGQQIKLPNQPPLSSFAYQDYFHTILDICSLIRSNIIFHNFTI